MRPPAEIELRLYCLTASDQTVRKIPKIRQKMPADLRRWHWRFHPGALETCPQVWPLSNRHWATAAAAQGCLVGLYEGCLCKWIFTHWVALQNKVKSLSLLSILNFSGFN
jgi:hypothetical protein